MLLNFVQCKATPAPIRGIGFSTLSLPERVFPVALLERSKVRSSQRPTLLSDLVNTGAVYVNYHLPAIGYTALARIAGFELQPGRRQSRYQYRVPHLCSLRRSRILRRYSGDD